MSKKLTNEENIYRCAQKGLSGPALRFLLEFAVAGEAVGFDDNGNPYCRYDGEPLDSDVELKFED